MFTNIQRKLLNVLLFFDLIKLEKHTIPNEKKEIHVQNRRIRKLMKKAYKIPFYRKRFEAIGLHPSDFQCAEDLYKFPPYLNKNFALGWTKNAIRRNTNIIILILQVALPEPQQKYFTLQKKKHTTWQIGCAY